MTELSQRSGEHDSRQGIDIELLLRALAERDCRGVPFIHIGGQSASGKSTLSSMLASRLNGAQVLSVDSYLRERLWDPSIRFDHTPPDPDRPYIGGISPAIWDLDLMENDFQVLKRGGQISLPVFDETIKDRVGYQDFDPGKFLIVEGGQSYSDRFRQYANYRIMITAPLHDRIVRKIIRTHLLYGRKDIDEVLIRYVTRDEPVGRIYEAEHKSISDQVIYNPADPLNDYRHLPYRNDRPSDDRFFSLRPGPGGGELRPGERFGFSQDSNGDFRLVYGLDDRILIDLPVTAEVPRLISEYYLLEEEA